MTYDKLKAMGLEVDRGALATGFDERGPNRVSGARQRVLVNDRASRVPEKPPLTGDLSALNPKGWRRSKEFCSEHGKKTAAAREARKKAERTAEKGKAKTQ